MFYGEAGFTDQETVSMSLLPFAGLGYTFASADGFTETGTAPRNLLVESASGSGLFGALGVQWDTCGRIGDMHFRTSLRAGWEYRFTGGFAGLNVNFADIGAPNGFGFTSSTGDWSRDFAVVGASATVDENRIHAAL